MSTSNSQKNFRPDWSEAAPIPGTFRSILKYGSPTEFKHPSDAWFRMLRDEFALTDDDFKARVDEGHEKVVLDRPPRLQAAQIEALARIVGDANVALDDYSRVKYSSAKTAEEILELRRGIVREVSDVVLHPRHKEDVRQIVAYCDAERIPITAWSGGSSCNFGCRPYKGGVSLVMSTHMNQLLEVNETNQTARVQPGMFGPAYEEALNDAPARFRSKRSYTGGHFPQSFEYSTVGGWIVTLGSGQASTYYGDVADLVFAQEYVTPAGQFKTIEVPATATGPKVNDIMKGSEGSFGILVEATMRIYRHMPENRRRFSYMFPTWQAAVSASREIVQGEFGRPAVFRISDPEETDRGLRILGMPAMVDPGLSLVGYAPGQRSLAMGTVEGDPDYTRLVARKVGQVARAHGALPLGSYSVKHWEKIRYSEPYTREDMNDYGILIDTLEAGVAWNNVHRLHEGVREFIKSRPRTVCMTHASHFYPQGTNLYFIMIARMSLEEYVPFQSSVIERIIDNGGTLSHHHGVGRLLAPWMEKHLGREQVDVLRALKRHFDPNGIMNPGGQLGLDAIPPRR